MMPSRKIAIRPEYSLTSAPNDAKSRGADKSAMLKGTLCISYTSRIFDGDARKHDALDERAHIEAEVIVESDPICRRKKPRKHKPCRSDHSGIRIRDERARKRNPAWQV